MLYQFLPRLSDDEYAALEKSIRDHGIQVPIVVDENKSVIDGHHRKEIADRLGIDCPRRFAMDLDDTQKRTLALSLNLDRRHLSREQKRELIAKSLKADPQLSNRQHAERVGVSDKTVAPIRESLVERAEIPHVDQHTDSLGRQQPARVEREVVEDDTDYVTDQADLDAAFDGATDEELEQAFTAAREQGDVSSGNVASNLPDHTRREAAKPKRRPLTDAFFSANYDLRKRVESIHRLTQDDRFPQNAEKVAQAHLNDLIRTRDLLQQVIDSLNNKESSRG